MTNNNLSAKESRLSALIRYLILGLILWNIPGFTLVYLNGTLSSVLSYLSYGLILIYVLFNKKTGNNSAMLLIGTLYFIIGSLVNQTYMPDFSFFVIIIIKYFIIIWGGYEVMKHTSTKEFWFYMIIGAISILGNMFLFNDPKADYGRYSGFYLDPNNAGLICLIGFSLTFVIAKSFQLVGKITFTLLGLLTFSRTFILSWLLINLLSIRLNLKNAKMIALGFGILSTLLIYNEFLPVKNPRLEQIGAIFKGNEQKAKGIDRDSRWETWSRYYNALTDKPIFGSGYGGFAGNGVAPPVGVHNTYLLLWGEAGIIPILIFIFYLCKIFIRTNRIFKTSPYALMMLLALSLFLLTNHNFFTNDYSLLILLWIDIQSRKSLERKDSFSVKKDKLIPNSI